MRKKRAQGKDLFALGYIGHVDAVVMDAQSLVDHRCVRPLVQQRRDRVLSSVDDQQQWRLLGCLPKPKEIHV